MKQAKQLVHHPKSLEPTLGEGDVIRSPPVPPGVLECLKEISQELEDMPGQLLEYWFVLNLVKALRLFGER